MLDSKNSRPHPLAQSLGWLAFGLGAAELLVPRQLGKLIGLRAGALARTTLRLMGAREMASGLGILRGRRSRAWLGARVAGDVLDAGLLWRALRERRGLPFLRNGSRLAGALAAVGGVAALDVLATALHGKPHPEGNTRPNVTASITVDSPANALYAFWRDVANLPRFIPHLEAVTALDSLRSRWQAKLPGGHILSWQATIVEDEADKRIVWKLNADKTLRMLDSAEVRFDPAPGGQGTEVRITMWGSPVHAPAVVQRWLRKLPDRFWVQQLRRFKQLIELGEIPASDASMFFGRHSAQPTGDLANAPLAPPTAKARNGASTEGARS